MKLFPVLFVSALSLAAPEKKVTMIFGLQKDACRIEDGQLLLNDHSLFSTDAKEWKNCAIGIINYAAKVERERDMCKADLAKK